MYNSIYTRLYGAYASLGDLFPCLIDRKVASSRLLFYICIGMPVFLIKDIAHTIKYNITLRFDVILKENNNILKRTFFNIKS